LNIWEFDYSGNRLFGKLIIQEIEFVQKIEGQEVEVWEIDIGDIEIWEIEVREIEFGIVICNRQKVLF